MSRRRERLVEGLPRLEKGDRVELVCPQQHVHLRPGDRGTVCETFAWHIDVKVYFDRAPHTDHGRVAPFYVHRETVRKLHDLERLAEAWETQQ